MDTRTRRRARLLSIAAVTGTAVALGVAGPADAHAGVRTVLSGRTLYVVGTNAADTIGLAADPVAGTLRVDPGGAGPVPTFPAADFDRVVVAVLGGDDQVVVSAGAAFPGALRVYAGRGDDVVQGGDGEDLLVGGPGADRLLGGNGADRLVGNSGDDFVNGQRGDDAEFLGSGADVAAWLPGEGSDTVHGGGGSDRLDFLGANAAEKYQLAGAGSTAVLTRDLGQIRMDLADVEALALQTLGGADDVQVGDVSHTRLDSFALDLGGTVGGGPDGAVDTVSVAGTNRPDTVDVSVDAGSLLVRGPLLTLRASGAEAQDRLVVQTFGGDDEVTVSAAASALIGVSVDLGSGQR